MQFTAFGRTDVGYKRTSNQDAIFADDSLGLYIVCDGMGGYEGGEIASSLAIEAVVTYVRDHRKELNLMTFSGTTAKWLPMFVADAIKLANFEICFRAYRKPALEKMGSTISMIMVHDDVVVIGHCGDSRAYRIDESLALLTSDHTMGAEMREHGWEDLG